MILDLQSVLSSNQVITVTAPSTGVYDTAGLGVNVPAVNITGIVNNAAAAFGSDIGGGGPLAEGPQLMVVVGTAFAAAGAATLEVELQAAIDSGGGVPGAWQTIMQTDEYALATLTAGQTIANFTVPRRYPGANFPRFYRLNYVVATGPMTAGTISTSALLTGVDDNPLYPANF